MRTNIFNISGISDLNCDLLLGCSKNEFRDIYGIAILRETITKKTYTQRDIDLPARQILSL